MKKWMYVIFPGLLLVLFLFYYDSKMSELNARDQARAEAVVKQKAEEAAKKKAIEDKARQDAAKRSAELAAEDAAKEKEKIDKWNAEGDKIKEDTDRAQDAADEYSKQASQLEIELDALRKKKEVENREDFDLLKQVEGGRVTRHNAEMEIQRMVEMIARRADESSLTKMPPQPATAKND